MAVVAVLVATRVAARHRTHTEEIILQTSHRPVGLLPGQEYRRHTDELFADLTTVVASKTRKPLPNYGEKYGRSRSL